VTTPRTSRERIVRVELICETPPRAPDTEFGLQDTAGGLRRGVDEPDGSLRFEGEIRAVTLPDGTVTLRGDIVHGPPGGRFLYLACRAVGTASGQWIFRMKVPLAGADTNGPAVEARVRASRGGSVPLLGSGWTASRRWT
jgi:hypothetical protein